MNYVDQFGRWHDSPVTDEDPIPSNNGWIYTAYAAKLGFPIDTDNLRFCYELCWITDQLFMSRSPGKSRPPMSRDEILGVYFFGYYPLGDGWNFCPYKIPKFNLLKTISAFWRLRKAHRNAVWKDGGEPHAWRFAFSVPLTDRAFIYRCCGDTPPIIYRLIEWVDKKLPAKSNSGKLIRFLKYDILPDRGVWENYFGPAHPILEKVK